MVDHSYYVPLLPEATGPPNVYEANYIEENLRYLILQWPAFETETILPLIGDYGTIFVPDTACPAQGVEVALLRRLPRFFVIIDGDVERIGWTGDGWELLENGGHRMILSRAPDTEDAAAANDALTGLSFSASWNADLTISLAAERADGTLRLTRSNVTKMLFRAEMTWGRLGREHEMWAELTDETWAEARALKGANT